MLLYWQKSIHDILCRSFHSTGCARRRYWNPVYHVLVEHWFLVANKIITPSSGFSDRVFIEESFESILDRCQQLELCHFPKWRDYQFYHSSSESGRYTGNFDPYSFSHKIQNFLSDIQTPKTNLTCKPQFSLDIEYSSSFADVIRQASVSTLSHEQ